MHFPSLDAYTSDQGVYTLAWRFTDNWQDPWTVRLMGFKNGEQMAIRGAAVTLATALPMLFEERKWHPEKTAITVALGSADTAINPNKQLGKVAAAVAQKLGMIWLPNLLEKDAHRPLHSLHGADERQAELKKANYRAGCIPGAAKRIIVLDDLITRGDTLTCISDAIKKSSPDTRIIGVALGKNESQGYAANFGHSLSNDGVSAAFTAAWEKPKNGKG